jgi:hypothetical protein
MDKLFFRNLYKVYNLYILMDFYLVLSRRVCPRSSQPDGCIVKCPFSIVICKVENLALNSFLK